jgi:hypothetical protein
MAVTLGQTPKKTYPSKRSTRDSVTGQRLRWPSHLKKIAFNPFAFSSVSPVRAKGVSMLYDVALWPSWPSSSASSSFPIVADQVQADTPLQAVLLVMHAYHLRKVEHAAVADEQKQITRWTEKIVLAPDA